MDAKYKKVLTLSKLDMSKGSRTSLSSGSGKSTFSTQSKEDRYNEAFKNDFKSSSSKEAGAKMKSASPPKTAKKLPPLKNKPKTPPKPKTAIKLSPLKNKPKTPKPKSPDEKILFVWDAPISPVYNLRPFSEDTQKMEDLFEGIEEVWAKQDAEFERQKEEEWIRREEAFQAREKEREIEKAERERKLNEIKMRPRVPIVYQTPTPPVGEPKKRGRPKGSKNKPKPATLQEKWAN